jgi:hypothetical protein
MRICEEKEMRKTTTEKTEMDKKQKQEKKKKTKGLKGPYLILEKCISNNCELQHFVFV